MPTPGTATYSSFENPESATKETYSSRTPVEADFPRDEGPKDKSSPPPEKETEEKVESKEREEVQLHPHKPAPHAIDHGKGKSHTGPTGHGPKARR